MGYAAVVLAGGAGTRLGGATKPALPVGGRPMLHRVLAAVADASPRIVVGPPDLPLPGQVRRTLEQPPGGGPVAATAAGLTLVGRRIWVALLAADLPLLTPAAVRRLRAAAGQPGVDGAVFVDGAGRAQWLCGIWRTAVLRARLADLAGPAEDTSTSARYAGLPLWRLLGDLRAVRVGGESVTGAPPWWDCDTGADLQRAEELLHGNPG